jgi:hypothetical protein
MDGVIRVTVDGLESTYTPACHCGWEGSESATVEWAEWRVRCHFDDAHTTENAA